MNGKQATIPIVDDEENVRRLVRSMLGKDNIVLEAEDGEIAVHMARHQKPDFILMDIMMPKMDGYTACKIALDGQSYFRQRSPLLGLFPLFWGMC